VGASEATLLAKLGIKPFSYGLVIRQVRSSTRCLFLEHVFHLTLKVNSCSSAVYSLCINPSPAGCDLPSAARQALGSGALYALKGTPSVGC
jgi:hypothetical protein